MAVIQLADQSHGMSNMQGHGRPTYVKTVFLLSDLRRTFQRMLNSGLKKRNIAALAMHSGYNNNSQLCLPVNLKIIYI